MAQTFHCPNCAAPLTYSGDSSTVECRHCGSMVIVPESLRARRAGQVEAPVVQAPAVEAAASTGSRGLGLGFIILGIVLLSMGLPLYFSLRETLFPVELTATPTATPTPTPYAQLALAFGQEGIGPAHFSDARTMAVDAQGRIFVGEYSPGRIQAFTPEGTFLWQYKTPGKTDYVRAMAAGSPGQLYAVVSRDIYVFDAGSGALLAQWEPAPQQIGWYEALTVTPEGELLAVHPRELVKYDPRGKLLLQVGGVAEDFLKLVGVEESSLSLTGTAVDSEGLIYISTGGNFLLKLTPEGKLIDRVNGPLSEKGLYTIALDRQGRIAWVYDRQVILTGTQDRYFGEWRTGFLSDIEFNRQGQLVGISRSPAQVEVYTYSATGK